MRQTVIKNHHSSANADTRLPPRVNLYLVGFMGTGKTTVGRTLARRLGHRFVDSDHEIEKLRGKPVTEIFADEGEAAFRKLEWEFIESGHPAEGCVVACGGGLVTQPGMIELLKTKGVVVCLYATVQTVLQRTSGNKSRPLLNVENPERRVRELLAAREPFYRRAGTLVLTDNRGHHEIVERLLRIYHRQRMEFAKKAKAATARKKQPRRA